jgi:hypothetical protein
MIQMGGDSNGSTIHGHNYTYVGSTWGSIVQILIDKKCMNPIIFIDEVDKVSKTEHGKELIGILTHLIDSTQNTHFQDKYFSNIDLDLSKVLFIFSYNDVELLDKILLDRIHRIKFNNLSVKLNWPLLNCESFFLKEKKDLLLDSVSLFIESLKVDDKTICLKQFNPEQRIELFNKLPAKFQIEIQENVFNFIKQFNEGKFFNEETSKYLDLNFYNLSYQSILRLFFIENLENLYQLYFLLASRNMSPSEVDKMSVSERTIYFSFIQQEGSEEENEESVPETYNQ